jgi:hypothetical protein
MEVMHGRKSCDPTYKLCYCIDSSCRSANFVDSAIGHARACPCDHQMMCGWYQASQSWKSQGSDCALMRRNLEGFLQGPKGKMQFFAQAWNVRGTPLCNSVAVSLLTLSTLACSAPTYVSLGYLGHCMPKMIRNCWMAQF